MRSQHTDSEIDVREVVASSGVYAEITESASQIQATVDFTHIIRIEFFHVHISIHLKQ